MGRCLGSFFGHFLYLSCLECCWAGDPGARNVGFNRVEVGNGITVMKSKMNSQTFLSVMGNGLGNWAVP
eukprot:4547229-Amphidinium_carterae.1